MENIKSTYFIQVIFNFIKDRKKLLMVKYNKKLQNTINVNLINYKVFSGRYIIYETKKFGKEYNGCNDKLLYEGEYLKGEKNGKGRHYDLFGNLVFEGFYLNGKRWRGKNCEYNRDGQLLFEVEYLNGEFQGKYKGYYSNGKLEYEIEYLNGKKNGKFQGYFYDKKLKCEGEYSYGKLLKLKTYNPSHNSIYELTDGKGYIKGYYSNGDLEYEAEYLNGEKNGKGKEYYDNGQIKFEGEYLNGKKTGKGKEYFRNGSLSFEGEYSNDEKNGCIKRYNADGKLIFDGEYLKGKKWKGKVYYMDSEKIYELKNGKGKVKEFDDGGIIFEGENGNRNGKGKEINKEGELLFEGEYLNGKRWNGKGKEYNWNDELIFEGEYLNGKKLSSE